MIAFVDESVRPGALGELYLVTAAVVLRDHADLVRSVLRKQLRPGVSRFHWQAEGPTARLAMLDIIAEVAVGALVSWQYPIGRRRQEPARADCLTSLLGDLADEGVDELVIEAREDRVLNRNDRQTIHAARAGGVVGSYVAYRFATPRDEPLLWVPDAVAGAVGPHLAGTSSLYYDRLAPTLLHVRRVPV